MPTGIRTPAELRQPDKDGYGDTYEETRSDTPMQTGPARRRNRTRVAPRLFDVQWTVDYDTYQAFDIWWQETIKGGSLPFDTQLLDDDETLTWFTCYWVEGTYHAETDNAGAWVISGKLRTIDEPFTRTAGTNELGGRATVSVGGTGKLVIAVVLRGATTVTVTGTAKLAAFSMKGKTTIDTTAKGALETEGTGAVTGVMMSTDLVRFSGLDIVFGAGNLYSSTDGGLNWINRHHTVQHAGYFSAPRPAVLGTQWIAFDVNEASDARRQLKGTTTVATAPVYSDNYTGSFYDELLAYPRTTGGDPLSAGALYSDGTNYYLVGGQIVGVYTSNTMTLYSAGTGVTFTAIGNLVVDSGDPNAVSGAFDSRWFIPVESILGTNYSQLTKFGSRWFLMARHSIFYTDASDGLTGWLRCPLGYPDEGLTAGVNDGPITHMIKIGSTILVIRRSPITLGEDCLFKSTDNGATWTSSQGPLTHTAEQPQALIANGSEAWMYTLDNVSGVLSPRLYKAVSPFTSWSEDVVLGLPTSPGFSHAYLLAASVVIIADNKVGIAVDGITFTDPGVS